MIDLIVQQECVFRFDCLFFDKYTLSCDHIFQKMSPFVINLGNLSKAGFRKTSRMSQKLDFGFLCLRNNEF